MKLSRDVMQAVLAIAMDAGRAIMAIYAQESRWAVQQKGDDSPVTAADMAAHHIIAAALLAYTPQVPVLSEESDVISATLRQQWPQFWLVDPLDGTKEFIARNNEFSVNIALIDAKEAVLGVVYGPATGVAYVAARGVGAFRVENGVWMPIRVAALPLKNSRALRVCASRHHRDAREETLIAKVVASLGAVAVVTAGSAFKICAVADGSADAYPRFGPTMEWDTAAGQVVVEQAGGALVDTQGRPFRYNARPSLRNDSFLVLGDAPEQWLACWRPLFL